MNPYNSVCSGDIAIAERVGVYGGFAFWNFGDINSVRVCDSVDIEKGISIDL